MCLLKPMKIALIYPSNSLLYSLPPLGLISISTLLKCENYDVKVFDMACIIKKEGIKTDKNLYKNIADYVLNNHDADIVGFSCIVTLEIAALRIAHEIKNKKRNTIITFGNINASLKDLSWLKAFKCIDLIVRGEGELTFLELVDKLNNSQDIGKIPGITFRAKGGIKKNPARELISNLDTLSPLDYNVLHGGMCQYIKNGNINEAVLPVGRGCSFSCSYCTTPSFWERKVRFFSPQRIALELARLKTLGFNSIQFDIDNFSTYRDKAIEICDKISRNNITSDWQARCRLDCLDEELLSIMKKAGCKRILVGVESGDEKVLQQMNKKVPLDKAVEMIKTVSDSGIGAVSSFVVGLPADSITTILKTINLASKCASLSGLSQSAIHFLSPLPETSITKNALEKRKLKFSNNILISPDFAHYIEWEDENKNNYANRLKKDQNMIRRYRDLFTAYGYIKNDNVKP